MRKLLLCTILLAAIGATAQQTSNGTKKPADDLGWTSSMSFEGNADSSQRVLDWNSSVGYNLTKNWGADIGIPFEFVSSSTTTTSGTGGTGSASKTNYLNSLGNVFADLRFNAKGDFANYSSSVTAGAPTGSKKHGISSGRPTLGWNNHVEHHFALLTPFIEAGFGNSVMDSRLYLRPFTTLGFVSQFTGGTTVDLSHNFSIGASLYDVLPSGQQKLYSKLVASGSTQAVGTGSHGRAYQLAAETVGTSALTRDNGDSAWIDFSPGAVDFQVGYTHSVHYATNTFAFSMSVNLAKLMKKAATY